MVTSRSVPQQTAQIFSPLAGQKRAALRFSQMGQDTESPQNARTVQQNTRCGNKRQNRQAEVLGELERICNASLVCLATGILQITTLLRSKCGVWSVLQIGRATRYGAVGLPTGSFPHSDSVLLHFALIW